MTIRPLHRLGRELLAGGGALLLGWAGAGSVTAQPMEAGAKQAAVAESAPVPRNYLNKSVIQLPVQINEQSRSLISEIQLYSKEHAAAPWTMRDKVGPSAKAFNYQVPRDGEYWFTMVTVDRQGRGYPSDLRNEPPGLIVVIDTTAPQIELTNLGATPEGQFIQCDIRDANIDVARTRFHYQGGDKVFRALEPVGGRQNVYCIPAQAVSTGIVRATAEDLAGNQAMRELNLTQIAPAKTPAPQPQPNVTPPPMIEVKAPKDAKLPIDNFPRRLPIEVGSMATLPAPEKSSPVANAAGTPVANVPGSVIANAPGSVIANAPGSVIANAPSTPVANAPGAPVVGTMRPDWKDDPRLDRTGEPTRTTIERGVERVPVQTATHRETSKTQFVNSPKVFLDYQIENAGQSGVGKVEIWVTADRSKTWQKIGEDGQRKSPVEVNFPGDGTFGVTLIASNGRGVSGAPPAAGDAPDWWIEVDTTKPTAQLTKIYSATENGKSVVHIHWSVQDKNVGESPVDLFYAATVQGPWLPLAKGLKADGQYRWTPPVEIGAQAHLQLVAHDAAGNTAVVISQQAVQFDDPVRPRAVIRGVTTGATQSQFQIVQPRP